MDEFSPASERPRPIKSLSLKEIVNARPPFFRGLIEVTKTGLMIWGAISLSAAAGYAALHLQGGPDQPVLQSEAVVDKPAASAAERPRPASTGRADATEAIEPPEPPMELAARLPRPRPDEPVITGSIARAADSYAPSYSRVRRADPCEAWNDLGMPFRIRCVRETRAEPRYYPLYPQRW